MPKFISNSLIFWKGRTYHHGEELEMPQENADALGDKVVPMKLAAPKKPLKEMYLKELKPLAKAVGIENYSSLNKDELVAVLEAVQPEVVETDDEPAGG